MKLEKLLNEVIKLNKQNESLHTARPKYLEIIVRDVPSKTFKIYKKTNFKDIRDCYIEDISNQIFETTFEYSSVDDCFTSAIYSAYNGTIVVDVIVEEVE